MESVIKKIFSGVMDKEGHNEFIKFSRGLFNDRYVIEGKKQKDKWSIKTSAEFSNFFVRKVLEAEKGEIDVKGVIVSTFDLASKVKFPIENVKKYMGIQQAVIKTKIDPKEILGLMEEYPRVHFGLSIKTEGYDLKIKAKAPKSGKPGKKGDDEGPKADFCSIKTEDKELVGDLLFDYPEFKEIKVRHSIEVKEIVLPEGEEDPVKLRENSVRKGVVKRIIDVDGKKEEKEAEFSL